MSCTNKQNCADRSPRWILPWGSPPLPWAPQPGLGPVPGGCRPRVVCGVPAGSTGPGGRSSSFLRLLKTPGSAGRSAEPPSRLSLPSLPFSVSSLTKDHRKRPKYNKLLVSTWGPSCPAPALLRSPAHLDTQGLGEASQEAALVLSSPLGPHRNIASSSAMRRWRWTWRPGSRMSWQRPSHRGLAES